MRVRYKKIFFFQFKSDPVNLHKYKDFPSFPRKLPLPTEFKGKADVGSPVLGSQVSVNRVRQPERRARGHLLREGLPAPCGLPRTRAGGRRREETAGLRGQPGGTPTLPQGGVGALPPPWAPGNGLRRQRQMRLGEAAVDGDPSARASGWGFPPGRPQTAAGQPRAAGVPPLRGDDRLARRPRPSTASRRPRPLTDHGQEGRVPESVRGRWVLTGRLPWCT